MSDNGIIAKNAIIIYVRMIVTALVGIISSRFVIRALGADDYGLSTVVGSVTAMMVFINTVMAAATYRYVAFEMGKGAAGNVNKVFNTSRNIHILIAVIVLLLSATIGEFYIDNYLRVDPSRLADARFVFRVSIASFMVTIFVVPYNGLLMAYENFNVMAVVDIVQRFVVLGVSIFLMSYVGNRLRLYSLSMSVLGVLFNSVYIIYCHTHYRPSVRWRPARDRSLYREMISFSGWMALGVGANVGKTQFSAIIVNHFFGTLLNAAYGIANTINNMVGQFSRAIAQAAAPQITKSYSGNNRSRSVDLASYISKYTAFSMLLIAVPLIMETDFLLDLWIGADVLPPYATIMCRLILISLMLDGMGEGLTVLVQATGRVKWFQIAVSATTLLPLPLAWTLFSLGAEPYAVVVCFIIADAINLFWRPFLLHKLIDFDVKRLLHISYIRILYVVLTMVPLFFVVTLFPEGWARFLTAVPLSVVACLASIWFLGTDDREHNIILNAIKTRLK